MNTLSINDSGHRKARLGIAAALATIIPFMMPSSAAAQTTEQITAINASIKSSNASWRAVENRFTAMTPAQRRAIVGQPAPVDPDPDAWFGFQTGETPAGGYAAAMNWQNNGGNWVTSAKDQGGCPSCWAFAAVGATESAIHIAENRPVTVTDQIDLAEQHVVSCSGRGCQWWYIDSAFNQLKNTGAPTESCFAYTGTTNTCSATCGGTADQIMKLDSWSWVTYSAVDVDVIKAAVAQRPIAVRMRVCDDFYSYGGGVFEHSWGDCTETAGERGHFVVIVGWDDAEQSWIVKNSWGTDWGDAGFFRIRWTESANGFGQWGILPAFTARTAAFSADKVSGTAPLTVTFTDQSNGNPISWAWNFGDSATGSVRNPQHQYKVPGTYAVSLATSWYDRQNTLNRTSYISVSTPDCNDNNPCTQDSYNSTTGQCDHPGAPMNGTACDLDSNGCTRDYCNAGLCTAGLAPDCSAMTDTCNVGTCSSTGDTTYVCVKNPTPRNGTSCNADSNGCTGSDSCVAGTCTPGPAVTCAEARTACLDATCSSTGIDTYQCVVSTAALDGKLCSDGQACTENDVCTGGSCVGTPRQCTDSFDCTDDTCKTTSPFIFAAAGVPFRDITGYAKDTGIDGDDKAAGPFPIGFDFPFGSGQTRTQFWVSSNGLITFDSAYTGGSNVCIPNSSTPNNFIAPYWDNLTCLKSAGCTVTYATVGTGTEAHLIVQWTGAKIVLNSATATFQAALFTDGSIEFRYATMGTGADGALATTGVEYAGGTSGMQKSCNMTGSVSSASAARLAMEPYCSSSVADGTCLISGVCRFHGDIRPDQPCQICDSTVSKTTWSNNDFASCDADGNGCTLDDYCRSGACVAGSAADCSAENDQCATGVCISTGAASYQCVKATIPHDGSACNADDDGCTVNDRCAAGTCLAGNAPDCSSAADQCNAGTCSSTGPSSFTCVSDPAPFENVSCNADSDGCTVDDRCAGGHCVKGTAPDCSEQDDQCNSGTCSSTGPSTWICVKDPVPHNGSSCDADNDGCTVADTCINGACTAGSGPDCSVAADQCNSGICNSTGPSTWVCEKNPLTHEGLACNADNDGCTAGDYCFRGGCVAGTVPDCSEAADECNVGRCVSTGNFNYECMKNPAPMNGELCDADGSGCTVDDTCAIGICTAGNAPDCSEWDDICNVGACRSLEANRFECVRDPVPKHASPCDADENGCTVGDSCVSGTCMAGPAPDCSGVSDQCNAGTCTSTGAGSFVCEKDPTAREGGACNADDDGCTADDYCSIGTCVPGSTPDCSSAADQCNVGLCRSTGPTSHACEKNPGPFEGHGCNADSSGCTENDTCAAGICQPGPSVDCSYQADDCNEGSCESTGSESFTCVKNPAPMNGLSCDADLDGCTADDYCVFGSCEPGNQVDCSLAGDQCTVGVCRSTSAFDHVCDGDPLPKEGIPCDSDSSGCTVGDYCQAGTCRIGVDADCSSAADQCNDGACRSDGPAAYSCFKRPVTSSRSCDDADPCTTNDSCSDGICTGPAKDCDDNLDCTADTCDGLTGSCSHSLVDSACDDANRCTVDRCMAGSGCENTPVDDWVECGDTTHACFGGTCEKTATNDTCEEASALQAGVTAHADSGDLHAFRPVDESCAGSAFSGPDAFFSAVVGSAEGIVVTLNPTGGAVAGLAVRTDCRIDAACIGALVPSPDEQSVEITGLQSGTTVIIQVVVTGCEGSCDSDGFDIVFNDIERPGDQTPDSAEDASVTDDGGAGDSTGDSFDDVFEDASDVPSDIPADSGNDLSSDDVTADHGNRPDAITGDTGKDSVVAYDTVGDLPGSDENGERPSGGSGCSSAGSNSSPLPFVFLMLAVIAPMALMATGRRRRS